LGEKISSIDEVSTKIRDTYTVIENEYETTLKNEIIKWDEYINEAGEQIGSTGKPLQHRYIANKITKGVDSSQAKEILPPIIVNVVEKIRTCSYRESLLKKT